MSLQVTGSTSNSIPAVMQKQSIPSEHEMMVYHTMAKQAVSSKMYKGIGDEAGVMMIMLAARELSIPPMQALNGGLNIIQGKVEISARMMNALIRRSGHSVVIHESTDEICTLFGKRCDNGDKATVSFSMKDAQKAGLIKQGGGWTKFPKDMCFARSLSRLARQLFSDVIGIGYIEGEISQVVEIKNSEDDNFNYTQDIETETLMIESEEECLRRFLDLFNNEDKHFALEYLKVVQKHFGWTPIQTISELLNDQKKLFDKFHAWKSKIKKVD